jgi:SPP1 family predicted phage head-tail adaptor
MVVIGTLSERITLQTKRARLTARAVRPSAGQTLATIAAQVTPMSAGEAWRNGQQLGTQTYRFTIRARADLSTAQRLQWRNHNYNIQGFLLNENPRYHDIIATAGGAL